MTATSTSIINGTISDDAAVAELFRRQKHFAADVTLADSVRLQGQAVFNTALFTDIPAAIQTAKPVAAILRQTIESIGALYLQSEKREAVIHVADSGGDEHEHDQALRDIASKKARRIPELHSSTDESDAEEIPTPDRIAAAMAARQKRRLATHGAKRRMSAAAGVVKALQRTSRGRAPAFAGINNLSLNNQMVSNVRQALPASKQLNKEARRSLIVRLKAPKSYCFQAVTIMASQIEMPAKGKFTRHSRQSRIKSEESVTSDLEDSEAMGKEMEVRRSPRSRKTVSGQISMTPHSEEEEDMDEDDDMDEPPLRLTRPRTGRNSAPAKSPEVSKTDEDEIEPSQTEDDSIPDVNEPFAPTPRSRKAKTNRSQKSRQSSHPSEDETDTSIPSTSRSTPATTPSTHSAESAAIKLISAHSEVKYKFPPFPRLDPRQVVPFHLGATIASENIREDYELNPTDSLLDLLTHLSDNKPIVDDWERRTVLEGGIWVCDVLRKYAIGKGGGKVGGKGKGKRAMLGVDVDVLGLVGGLEGWIERERGRLEK